MAVDGRVMIITIFLCAARSSVSSLEDDKSAMTPANPDAATATRKSRRRKKPRKKTKSVEVPAEPVELSGKQEIPSQPVEVPAEPVELSGKQEIPSQPVKVPAEPVELSGKHSQPVEVPAEQVELSGKQEILFQPVEVPAKQEELPEIPAAESVPTKQDSAEAEVMDDFGNQDEWGGYISRFSVIAPCYTCQ